MGKFKKLNNAGVSLVEVLIVAGIMAIISVAAGAMITNQLRETKASAEKMAALDVQRLLMNILTSGSVCSAELSSTVFNPAGPYKIDTTSLVSQVINLPSIHASKLATAPVLIAIDQQVSARSANFKIESISFKNFISAGTANLYLVDLIITFKGGIRSFAPLVLKMIVETSASDPANAKSIINCAESGKTDKSYRFIFNSTQTWTVPPGVTNGFVTMAGGGGSGVGWRAVSAVYTGHSGGYVFSHPINLVGGETLNIVVGNGGRGFGAINTGTFATPGPPYYIFTNSAVDDGLGGYPGGTTQIISPTLGTLLECSGGSGVNIGGVDSFSAANPVAGNLSGALFGGGTPSFPSPNRFATGSFATPNGPGACGLSSYGRGNAGAVMFGVGSGIYSGGTTPFGFGSGASVTRMGCHVTPDIIGVCVWPADGKDGVVYIDVRY